MDPSPWCRSMPIPIPGKKIKSAWDHGTMFYHAAREGLIDTERSVQVAIRTLNEKTHGFTVLDADWVHLNGVPATIDRITQVVGDGPAYLTFDIDALDPAFAPGTGTPVCGGLSTWQAQSIVRGLTSLDLVGADLVEVSPAYDHAEITALAAASILLDIICPAKAPARSDRRLRNQTKRKFHYASRPPLRCPVRTDADRDR